MGLLRRNPALGRVVAAQTISPLGDAMATVAVLLHLQATGGTGSTVAVVMFAEAIPPVLAPLSGTLADRVRDPRRLIALAAVLQGAVIAATALALHEITLPVLAGLLFVRAAIDTASAPALASIVPATVSDEDLPAANTTISAATEIGAIIGPPFAAFVFAAAGASWALGVDALTFLLVVPLIATLPALRPARDDGGAVQKWRSDISEGIRLVWRTPALRAIAVGFWITVFMAAPDDLVLAFLGRDTFHASPFTIGVLLAAASVGLVGAAPFVGRIAQRLGAPIAAITAGGIVVGIGNLMTAVSPVLAAAFAMQVVRGAGVVLYDAAGVRTFLQRSTPSHLLGRVFANVYGGVSVAAALGYVVGGPLLDATSPRIAFTVVGIGTFAGVAVTNVLLRRAPQPG